MDAIKSVINTIFKGNSVLGWRPPKIPENPYTCPTKVENLLDSIKEFTYLDQEVIKLSPEVQKIIQKSMNRYGENANNGTDEFLYKTDDITALTNVKSNDASIIESVAILGKGSYGIAILIKNKETNAYYVVKRLYSKECKIIDEKLDEYINAEVDILKYINTRPELDGFVPKLKAYIKHTPGDAATRLIHYNIENSENKINISKIHKDFKYKPAYYEIITDYYEGLDLLDFVLLFNELCKIHYDSLRDFGRYYTRMFNYLKSHEPAKYIKFLKLIRLLNPQTTIPTNIFDYSVEENILMRRFYTDEIVAHNPNNINKRKLFEKFITTITNLYNNSILYLTELFNVGIFHRDIKPENFYVYLKKQPDNTYIPTLLFLDFGFAIHDRITAENATNPKTIGFSRNRHSYAGTIKYVHPLLIELYRKYNNNLYYHDNFDKYALYTTWQSIIGEIHTNIPIYAAIKLFSSQIQPSKLINLYTTIYENIDHELNLINIYITNYARKMNGATSSGGKRKLNKTYKNLKNTHKTIKNKKK